MAKGQEPSETYQKLTALVSWTLMLAEMQISTKDVATAVATFDKEAAMEPSNARIIQQWGACKNMLGDHAGAIADLSAANQLGLDDALTYTYRGETHMRLGQCNIALADPDQAVAKEPERHHHRDFVV